MPWLFNKSFRPIEKKLLRDNFLKHKTLFITLQVSVFVVLLAFGVSYAAAFTVDSPRKAVNPSDVPTFEILQATSKPTPISSEPTTQEEESSSGVNNNIGGPPPGLVRCMADYTQAHNQTLQQHNQLKLIQSEIETRFGALHAEWAATGLASVGNGLPTPEFQARFDALQAEYDYTLNSLRALEQKLSTMQPRDFNCD